MGTTTMANGAKFERKWLAHFIHNGSGYQRLGKDLEELAVEMNADSESKKNILGESSTRVSGYDPSYSVDSFYAEYGDPLFEKMSNIINQRSTGSELETTVVDVLMGSDGAIIWAYQEDAVIIPQSIGGDTSGVQIPFEVHYNGNRKDVTAKVSIENGVLTVSA